MGLYGKSRRCRDEEQEESIDYLCNCSALTSAIHKFLGKHFFDCLAELASAKIEMAYFITASQRILA